MDGTNDLDRWQAAVSHMQGKLDEIEAELYEQAENLTQEANRHISEAVQFGAKNCGLGLSTRRRYERWGFRLVWVRSQYVDPKKRPDLIRRIKAGTATRYTNEMKLVSGLYMRAETFRQCSEPLQSEMLAFEQRAVVIRRAVRAFKVVNDTLREFGTADVFRHPNVPRSHRLSGGL